MGALIRKILQSKAIISIKIFIYIYFLYIFVVFYLIAIVYYIYFYMLLKDVGYVNIIMYLIFCNMVRKFSNFFFINMNKNRVLHIFLFYGEIVK
jgi:hypothetical protein